MTSLFQLRIPMSSSVHGPLEGVQARGLLLVISLECLNNQWSSLHMSVKAQGIVWEQIKSSGVLISYQRDLKCCRIGVFTAHVRFRVLVDR